MDLTQRLINEIKNTYMIIKRVNEDRKDPYFCKCAYCHCNWRGAEERHHKDCPVIAIRETGQWGETIISEIVK